MSGVDQLLHLASTFADAEGLGFSTLSWRVFGDTKKLTALKDGGDIQVRRYELAVQWFSDHWPDHLDWPESLARPAPQPASESATNTGEAAA